MFAPSLQQETVSELANNVRPRGDFTYALKRNGKDLTITGIYQRIDRPHRLEFTWHENAGPEALVQAEFEPDEGRTKMRVTVKLDTSFAPQADHIKQLWSARATLLANLLSKKS